MLQLLPLQVQDCPKQVLASHLSNNSFILSGWNAAKFTVQTQSWFSYNYKRRGHYHRTKCTIMSPSSNTDSLQDSMGTTLLHSFIHSWSWTICINLNLLYTWFLYIAPSNIMFLFGNWPLDVPLSPRMGSYLTEDVCQLGPQWDLAFTLDDSVLYHWNWGRWRDDRNKKTQIHQTQSKKRVLRSHENEWLTKTCINQWRLTKREKEWLTKTCINHWS